jgi:hypothetical protein
MDDSEKLPIVHSHCDLRSQVGFLPFGTLVSYVSARRPSGADCGAKFAIAVGYDLAPGGIWSGDNVVVDWEHWLREDSATTNPMITIRDCRAFGVNKFILKELNFLSYEVREG